MLITSDNLPHVLAAIAWPSVALCAIWLFRSEFKRLARRITQARIWGDKGVIDFGDLPGDEKNSKSGSGASPEPGEWSQKIDKTKPANLFWLGSDLMQTFDFIVRGASRDKILYIIRQANHHLKAVGLANSPLQERLQKLSDSANRSLQMEWESNRRAEFAEEIRSILNSFGGIVEASQPGFEGKAKQ